MGLIYEIRMFLTSALVLLAVSIVPREEQAVVKALGDAGAALQGDLEIWE